MQSLTTAGIPARVSCTAGTYLCNALMYHVLTICDAAAQPMRGGFIHLPYLPSQVASLMQQNRLELEQRSDLASMSLETQIHAIRLALQTCIESDDS